MSIDGQFNYMRYKYVDDCKTAEIVGKIKKNCEAAIQTIKVGRKKQFAKELMDYIEQRRYQICFFSDDNYEIRRRALYIEKVIKALTQPTSQHLDLLLTEQSIISFKGMWSKNLYTILTKYRDAKEVELDQFPPSQAKISPRTI